MSHHANVSLAGRWAYLRALKTYWPEALDSLQHDVLPVYQPTLHTNDAVTQIAESWLQLQSDLERRELLAAMQRWGERFRITEEWIFDAALETLDFYYSLLRSEKPQRNENWFWRYSATGLLPCFEPTFGKSYLYPRYGGWPEPWEEFRNLMESEFSACLARFKRDVEFTFGIGREETLERDAKWTARYQKGETAIEIAETEDLSNSTDPEQLVFRAIERFARIIGLNLRRRGERIRRKIPTKRG
jgi:hypothetical protein